MRRTAAVLVALSAMGLTAGAAQADAPPFRDPDAVGFLALCDRSGHQVTSGDLAQAPFAWKAVASSSAPAGYTGSGRKAVLVAFQPRRQIDPGQWSGSQLTASTAYTSPAHPVAQATDGDGPLLSFVQAYPAKWDGLVQLRLYFSAPGVPPHRRPYPATTIRVTGNRWQVVDGGQLDCNAGSGTSVESVYLPPPSGHPAVAARAAANGRTGSAPASTPSTTAAGASSAAEGAGRAADRSFLGSPASYAVLVLLLGVLTAAGLSARRFLGSARRP